MQSMNVGNAIYCMDWPLLSVNEKKELLIVMIRSTIPIKFTSSFLITLSLQSYSNVSIVVICISTLVIKFLFNIINVCGTSIRKISEFFNNYIIF